MEDKAISGEDLKAINYFSKISFSSQTFIGNWKKGNCSHFDGNVCTVWSWADHEFSGLNKHFVMGKPEKRKDKLVINPEPFFCAMCPKWVIAKETLHNGSRV